MGLPSGTFSRSYPEDSAVVRTRMQWGLLTVSLILLLTLPFWLPSIPVVGTKIVPLSLVNVMGIYIIAVLGLQIMMGYAGQLSIGHAAFMAVGAYTSGLLTTKLGFPFWLALPCAGLLAGVIGVIFGASSLRMKGFYLIAATLAAQAAITWFVSWWAPVTGGETGLSVPAPTIGGFSFNTNTKFFYIIIVLLLLGTFFARNLIRTRIGRAFIAVRDNELAANVMGINVTAIKLLAFFIGCTYAGVAGSLWAHWQRIVFPDLFTLWLSIWFIGYLIIGGVGTTVGAFVGVILIEILGSGLSAAVSALGTTGFVATARDLLFGVIIILFLIFEPKGLAHRWMLFKISYRLYPYSY